MMIGGGRWPITKLKRVTYRVAGGTPESDNEAYWCDPTDESATAWVAIGDMSQRQVVTSTTRAVTSAGLTSKRLTVGRPGTVLLAMYASVGEVATLGVPAAWNQAILGLNCLRGAFDSRYLGYLLRSMKPDLVGMTRSNTQDNLNAEQIGNLEVPCPPIGAQSAIADFLDRETAKIDALIEKQERLLERLRERRFELVRHAMGGLDVTEPRSMRTAAWLGPVPSVWRTRPLWSIFKREKRTGYIDEQMVSVFREYGVVYKEDFDNLNITAEDRSIYQLIEPGWLVINRMKAWQGSVGVSNIRGIVSGHYICFRPNHNENSKFLNLLFRSPQYRDGFAMNSRGVRPGQAEIDNDLLRKMPVLLPPADEQARIVAHVDARTADIEQLTFQAARLIGLAAERRTALIIAAVTGQFDVSTGKAV